MAEQIKKERVKFPKGKQRLFIEGVDKKLNLGWDELSRIFGINRRTLSDWRREKSTMGYGALLKLCNKYEISFPKRIKILSQFWHIKQAAKLGALVRNRLYGNPGTPEGRRKGGLTTIKKFMSNPKLATKLRVKVRKEIRCPRRCLQLAEFIGIVLGDGGLTDYQLRITFNKDTDIQYALFVQKLIKKLFSVTSKIISKKLDKGSDIVVYGKNLVEFLEANGLKRGNKIKNRVDIPSWIKQNRGFQVSCLRGLMDTDGSFYPYSHIVNQKKYLNFALCFTSRSENLLRSTFDILKTNKFRPTRDNERIYLYRREDIKQYVKVVGSHNPKHLEKYKKFTEG